VVLHTADGAALVCPLLELADDLLSLIPVDLGALEVESGTDWLVIADGYLGDAGVVDLADEGSPTIALPPHDSIAPGRIAPKPIT